AHIERMHAINPRLNAVVEAREARARQEALAADRALEERGPDRVGPLHGVPCTIKESFEVEGMPHTAGLVAR
ncbi:partial Acylamidase, partial [Anaerolineae bacterium]